MGHLGAGRHQQGLFAAAAGHGAGSQVGDEGPGAEHGRMSRHDEIDIDQAGQDLGDLLHHRAGQRRRAGRAGLAGGQQQNRHAGPDPGLETAAGVFGKVQRRHHETSRHADEGPLAPLFLAAGKEMQHLHGVR